MTLLLFCFIVVSGTSVDRWKDGYRCDPVPSKLQKPQRNVVALRQAHAHNDYLHKRPLLDALANGFTSVEADIFLVNGKLLVAHTRREIKQSRTLEALYLAPLRKHIRQQKGQVYPTGEQLLLLIDIKNNGEATYKVLHKLLAQYADIVTKFTPKQTIRKPVLVVISGARPRDYMLNQKVRYAGYDGRVSDLKSDLPPSFMPLISDSWYSHFLWFGKGPMPAKMKQRLAEIVKLAHAKGRRVRFWATYDLPTPRRENIWRELLRANVDLINTDDLEGLRRFLLSRKKVER
ncbi:MAG: phosphatidylinositol-specific phospholipase C/glycerophosphodiester phosphodiesterase family protein [Gemmataceae bacterium]